MTARDRILDATEECLREHGIRRTTVAMVAEQAGVSRAWLYRHYPDKASLVGAALVRMDESFWENAHRRISQCQGLAEQVTEAVLLSRTHQPPLVLALREAEPEAFALVVGSGIREVLPGMNPFWHRYLEAARDVGEVRADLDVPRAAEWLLRVVLSLVTVPGEAVDADDRASVLAFVHEFFVPGLT